ncbi:MAG: hypothetical protein HRT92_08945 [Piscirickettsiaceae bacterium]|nr:hypothetical protein [Piscirickettsiaceae bacterium]
MKKLNTLQSKVISELIRSGGKLDSYTLFKRSLLSFNEFSSSTNALAEANFIKMDEDYIYLTSSGRGAMISTSTTNDSKKKWRDIPDRFKDESNGMIGEPYLPNIELLDKRTFNIESSKVD